MKLPLPPSHKDPEEHILPLINIVFLLLIFFMVAGTLTAPPPFSVELPASERGGEVATEPLRIHLGRSGEIALEGREEGLTELEEAVAKLLEESPGRPVQVQADRQARADALLDLMDALRAAGVERIDLVTQREGAR
ncbi:biopolymer transporter ExbD [Halorhodospira abdelmalekii]|uniref:biopolymer transporter ExbD n=1 Tax=Halorhodospira abdelmalekii TaxID=421629 RepID=UPI001906E19D